MKIIIKDDMGNVVAEQEFSKEEKYISLNLDSGQLEIQPKEATASNFVGCYH